MSTNNPLVIKEQSVVQTVDGQLKGFIRIAAVQPLNIKAGDVIDVEFVPAQTVIRWPPQS
jgi:hypothetical protein